MATAEGENMECPVCGRPNPDTALMCECGLRFGSGDEDQRFTPEPALPRSEVAPDVLFDRAEIVDCAERLYRRANAIIFSLTAVGVLLGLVGGGTLGHVVDERMGSILLFGAIGAAVGGSVGREEGKNRAVMLRLEAQNALCNLQTAINTQLDEDGQ